MIHLHFYRVCIATIFIWFQRKLCTIFSNYSMNVECWLREGWSIRKLHILWINTIKILMLEFNDYYFFWIRKKRITVTAQPLIYFWIEKQIYSSTIYDLQLFFILIFQERTFISYRKHINSTILSAILLWIYLCEARQYFSA